MFRSDLWPDLRNGESAEQKVMVDTLTLGMGMVGCSDQAYIPSDMFDHDIILFDSATTTTGGDASTESH